MNRLTVALRSIGAALVLVLSVLIITGPALAQSAPPPADEKLLLQYLQGQAPQTLTGRVSIPDNKSSVLIQPEGRSWQGTLTSSISTLGAIALLGMILVLCVFYVTRGKIRIDAGPSQTRILRFNSVERFAHWLTAISFIVLALTGINLVWGKSLLIPLIGPEAFTAISELGKIAHNYISFAFVIGVVMMLVLWVGHNIPSKSDLEWLKAGGGLFAKGVHPPSLKFNAGQKGIFWSVVVGGILLSVSGYILMFPFTVTDVAGQQLALTVHAIVSLLLIAVVMAHIYIGSVGMEGAFEAMYSGEVDINWAKEHHNLWVAQVTGQPVAAMGRHAVAHGGDD